MDEPYTNIKSGTSKRGFLAVIVCAITAVALLTGNLIANEYTQGGEPDNFERAQSVSHKFTVDNSFPDPIAPLEHVFTVPFAHELLVHGVTSEEASYIYVQRKNGDTFCIGQTNPYDGTLQFNGYGLKFYSGDKLLARGYIHRSVTLYGLLLRLQ